MPLDKNIDFDAVFAQMHNICIEHEKSDVSLFLLDNEATAIAKKYVDKFEYLLEKAKKENCTRLEQDIKQKTERGYDKPSENEVVGGYFNMIDGISEDFSVYTISMYCDGLIRSINECLDTLGDKKTYFISESGDRLPFLKIKNGCVKFYMHDDVDDLGGKEKCGVEPYISSERYMAYYDYLKAQNLLTGNQVRNKAFVVMVFAVHFFLIAEYKVSKGVWM